MFHLRKWYLDLVTPEGGALIAYIARLQCLGFHLTYSALLLARPDQPATEHIAPGPLRWPQLDGPSIHWHCPALRTTGHWLAAANPLTATLLDTPAGHIIWHNHQPRASAEVRLADGTLWRGAGYVEELDMTIKPWALPFAALRWGRFHGENSAIAWIDWRDGLDQSWVFTNGHRDTAAHVTDSGLDLTTGRIQFTTGRLLRDSPVAHAAFPRAPWLAHLLPNGLARAHDAKWLSRAALHHNGTRDEGWALHEVVRWR